MASRSGVPDWRPHSMPVPASDQHAPMEVSDLSVVLGQPVVHQRWSLVTVVHAISSKNHIL